VLRDGGDILMRTLAKDLTHEGAKSAEIALINKHRKPTLTNLTDGGDGTSGRHYSSETREKIAAARRGKSLSVDTKAKLSAAITGRASPNKGKVLSAEWRANISAAGRSRMQYPAERDRISLMGKIRYANDNERKRTADAAHRTGPNANNKSGFKGVSFQSRTGKWVAQIKLGKQTALGRFHTPEDAARAYDKAAFEAWGRDCYLNFPAELAA
jgi:hypothetical protein